MKRNSRRHAQEPLHVFIMKVLSDAPRNNKQLTSADIAKGVSDLGYKSNAKSLFDVCRLKAVLLVENGKIKTGTNAEGRKVFWIPESYTSKDAKPTTEINHGGVSDTDLQNLQEVSRLMSKVGGPKKMSAYIGVLGSLAESLAGK